MELKRDDIIKALECFHQRILDTDLAKNIYESEIMAIIDALSLIKELTEENEKLLTVIFKKEETMQFIAQEKQADYDELQTVKAENERLRAEEKQSQILIKTLHDKLDEGYAKFADEERAEERAEIVKKFTEMLKPIFVGIDQIAKEMLEGE